MVSVGASAVAVGTWLSVVGAEDFSALQAATRRASELAMITPGAFDTWHEPSWSGVGVQRPERCPREAVRTQGVRSNGHRAIPCDGESSDDLNNSVCDLGDGFVVNGVEVELVEEFANDSRGLVEVSRFYSTFRCCEQAK